MDKHLINIDIPEGATFIDQGAFRDYKNLMSISIPETVTRVGKTAFFGCTGLTDINIPDSVLNIGEGAFKGCKNLLSAKLSDNILNIEDGTFYGCENLSSVVIPDRVKRIGDGAFYGCKNLMSVTIPDSVNRIGKWAFQGCVRLTVNCGQKSFAMKYCRRNRIKVQIIDDRSAIMPEIKKEQAQVKPAESQNSAITAKINEYIAELGVYSRFITDATVSQELAEIKNILAKMINLLKDEKEIEKYSEQLDQFFNSYFPTVIKILGTYCKIEEQGLTVRNAVETKERIAASIPSVRKALEQELDNMYQNKMLDITTDIDVLESMLAKDGLIDNSPLKFDL
jgi:hypothetical protein